MCTWKKSYTECLRLQTSAVVCYFKTKPIFSKHHIVPSERGCCSLLYGVGAAWLEAVCAHFSVAVDGTWPTWSHGFQPAPAKQFKCSPWDGDFSEKPQFEAQKTLQILWRTMVYQWWNTLALVAGLQNRCGHWMTSDHFSNQLPWK